MAELALEAAGRRARRGPRTTPSKVSDPGLRAHHVEARRLGDQAGVEAAVALQRGERCPARRPPRRTPPAAPPRSRRAAGGGHRVQDRHHPALHVHRAAAVHQAVGQRRPDHGSRATTARRRGTTTSTWPFRHSRAGPGRPGSRRSRPSSSVRGASSPGWPSRSASGPEVVGRQLALQAQGGADLAQALERRALVAGHAGHLRRAPRCRARARPGRGCTWVPCRTCTSSCLPIATGPTPRGAGPAPTCTGRSHAGWRGVTACRSWPPPTRAACAHERLGDLEIHRVGGRSTVFPRVIWRGVRGRLPEADVVLEVVNGITFLSPLWLRTPSVTLVHHVHRGHYVEEMGRKGAVAALLLETLPLKLLYARSRFSTISNATADEMADLGIDRERSRSTTSAWTSSRFRPGRAGGRADAAVPGPAQALQADRGAAGRARADPRRGAGDRGRGRPPRGAGARDRRTRAWRPGADARATWTRRRKLRAAPARVGEPDRLLGRGLVPDGHGGRRLRDPQRGAGRRRPARSRSTPIAPACWPRRPPSWATQVDRIVHDAELRDRLGATGPGARARPSPGRRRRSARWTRSRPRAAAEPSSPSLRALAGAVRHRPRRRAGLRGDRHQRHRAAVHDRLRAACWAPTTTARWPRCCRPSSS